ncbi:hypothetical protein [Rhodococcoides fascians]|uniref:hypothetical protein n=1 Tax=Rhodococcoides fascians TaxID=1828 RepID=UPI0005623186|nr:hypothetical protein [Rhodococcus fascians]
MASDYSDGVAVVIRELDEQLTGIGAPYAADPAWIQSWWDSAEPAPGPIVTVWDRGALVVDPFPVAASAAFRAALGRLGDLFYPDAPCDVVDNALARAGGVLLRHVAVRSREQGSARERVLAVAGSLESEAMRAMASVAASHG